LLVQLRIAVLAQVQALAGSDTLADDFSMLEVVF